MTRGQQLAPMTMPKQAFDMEYMTEWLKEVRFLASRGIQYTFVRKTKDYGIKQYKYTKTPELFIALADFYYQESLSKQYTAIEKKIASAEPLERLVI